MTPAERKDPGLLSNSKRVGRIAKGSGTTEKDVRELINDYNKMKKFYTMFKNDRNMRKNLSKFMKK
jgi:signal recognition particle subunit SRP54